MKRTALLILILAVVLAVAFVFSVFAKGKEGRAFLGVTAGEVTSDIASDYGVKAGGGVIVEDVSSDSPAEEAGLRENDVIVKLNGKLVTGPQEFRSQIRELKPGDTVDLEYMRGGQMRKVKIKLTEREERPFGRLWDEDGRKHLRFEGAPWDWRWESEDDNKEVGKVGFAGIVTQSLSKGLAGYFKVEKGALISEVVKDSPAEQAGLKAGDVIIKIAGRTIEDESDVRAAIREHKPGETVVFVVVRDGNELTINVTLGENEPRYGEGIRRFRIGDKDIEVYAERLTPSPEDMDRLRKQLEKIEIELKDLPDIPDMNINVHPELDQVKVEIQRATPISQNSITESLYELYQRIARKVCWLGKAIEAQKTRLQQVGNRLVDVFA